MKQQVATAKSNMVNELAVSSDPGIVASQGAAMTAGLTTTPNLTPLGNMFSDWSNAYMTNMNARTFNPTQPSLFSQLTNMSYGFNS